MRRSENVIWLPARGRSAVGAKVGTKPGHGFADAILAGGLLTGLAVAGQTLASLLSVG